MVQKISKSKLKTKMLEIFRQLEDSGDELIVTDRGKPVFKIITIKGKKGVKSLFGDIQGQVVNKEDPNASPLHECKEDI